MVADSTTQLLAGDSRSSENETDSISSSTVMRVSPSSSSTDLCYEVEEAYQIVSPPLRRREPLRFSFRGYSLWLELEEFDNDITKAIHLSATELGLVPIPRAHVTAIYGMDHFREEQEVVKKFQQLRDSLKMWPNLRPRGIVCDAELQGVNNGKMDMTWSDISFASSPEHEQLISILHEMFEVPSAKDRPKWNPHCSLSYDNPENSPLTLQYTANLVTDIPTLLSHERKVKGISLWSSWGTMNEWRCIERIGFEHA